MPRPSASNALEYQTFDRLSVLNLVGRLLVIFVLASALVIGPTLSDVAPSLVWADDDDDDDDDDHDSGGGSNSSSSHRGSSDSGSSSSWNGSSGPSLLDFLFAPRREPARSPARPPTARPSAPTPLPDFAPAEIVALGLTDESVTQLEAQGYSVLQRDELGITDTLVTRLRVPSGTSLEDARVTVEAVQPGSEADFNHFYRPGEDHSCDELWCIAPNLIDWPDPKSNATCFADVMIGLIDTGINADHEALRDSNIRMLAGAEETQPASGLQHGTAVAAMLVGSAETRSPGLLPDATIVAVDAFYRGNQGDDRSDVYTLVRSLDRLANHGAQIINMSLAGPPNALLEDMVELMSENGVWLIAAAGNAGPRSDPAFPAAYDNVFAVTAIDNGRRVFRRAGRGDHIDFAAPGVEVWTAASISGARTRTGTSFATPFVTAALAVLRTNHPELRTYAEAETLLVEAAEDLGEPGFDPVFGHGLIQATGLCANGDRGTE